MHLRRNIYLMWPKWADKLRLEMAKLACLFHWKLWMRYCILPSSWRQENTSSSFTLKVQWWCLFLLLHNQLLIINSNQCKSITLRRIGEWLSIFIDWLRQSISINRFLLIFIYNIDWNQQLIFIDWYRRGRLQINLLGLRQCARCHALRNAYWGPSIPGIGWKRSFVVSLGVFSHRRA